MKRIFTFFIMFFMAINIYSQERVITTDLPAINEELINLTPEQIEQYYLNQEKQIKEYIANNKATKGTVYQIPVVFHILTDNASHESNISDCIIQNQIDILNAAFRKKSGTRYYNTNPVGADTEIEFFLACKDPNGNTTTGIDRVTTSSCNYTGSNSSTIMGVSKWATNKYLNIWVVKSVPSGTRAQAWWGNTTNIGIIVHYSYVGSKESGCPNISYIDATTWDAYDLGTTLIHETGHFFNLLHTFENCTTGDYCGDTPAVTGNPEPYCNTNNETKGLCSGTTRRMYENYMDYTDDACMNIFTTNQATRMRSYITSTSNYTNMVSSANITAVGCGSSGVTVTISNPVNNTNCTTCNGSATATPTGTSPYTYSWSGGKGTSASATGLCAGTYTVTVTDAASTTGTATVTITNNTSNPTANVSTTQTACTSNTGTATANASGATTPYSYIWNNSGNTMTISNLSSGSYSVTVTAANGCTVTASGTVATTNGPTANVSTTAAGCTSATGSATANASGGTTPYSYLWNNSGNTQTISNLSSGSYSVTVTAADGCTVTASGTVSTTNGPTANVTTTNVSSQGGSDGSVTANVSGGTSPYSYIWSGSIGNSATINGLPEGTYTVTVNDANSCSSIASGTIAFSSSQNITVIDGVETNTYRYSVMDENYNYSLYQHIYKKSLINTSGYITSIQFEHQGVGVANTNCKIYMAESTKSSFSSNTDYVNTGLTEVYSGTITSTTDGWYEITLSTPFMYSNTNNLIIAIDRKTGTSAGLNKNHFHATADANVTLRYRSSTSQGDVGNWSASGTKYGALPNLKLTFGSGGNLKVCEIVSSNSAVNIFPNPNEGEFSISINNTSINNANIKILDINGKIIIDEVVNFDGELLKKYNLKSFSSGVYFIKIITENEILNKKIIIN